LVTSLIVNTKNRFSIHRKKLTIALLLLAVLIASLFIYGIAINSTDDWVTVVVADFSLEDAVPVTSEIELKAAINNENAANNTQTIIALNKDISLTETLTIPTNTNIILTSNKTTEFYKLTNTVEGNTITINTGGRLQISGIIVTHTHKEGTRGPGRSNVTPTEITRGTGVYVEDNGILILSKGEISGNVADSGVVNRGTFKMTDGTITKNTAGDGGGVYNSGNFSMSGGAITNNRVGHSGGGVFNWGNFSLSGGEISNNNAAPWEELLIDGVGGGVFNLGTFSMSGGTIINNADKMGANDISPGGIFKWSGGTIANKTKHFWWL
jgi:hypothetical protein